ncbi:MAG TPA: hypothetical protein VN457_01935, partial [Chlamydiales bacterium]|nr:hypothetical protein [Chlamydiales bacterium]
MALFATILTLPLLFAADIPFDENKLQYLISKNRFDEVLIAFLEEKKQPLSSHALHTLCYKILENGIQAKDTSEVILALYGIQCSLDDSTFHLLETAIHSPVPEIQLTAVQVAGTFNNAHSHRLLEDALASNWLIIRLEALSLLASQQQLEGHLEAEISKVEPEVRPFFPELLAIDGSEESRKLLKKLSHDSDPQVRLEAIRSLLKASPDDFYSQAKYFSHELHPAIQELLVDAFLSSRDDAILKLASPLSTTS